jgi:hypothetical protein
MTIFEHKLPDGCIMVRVSSHCGQSTSTHDTVLLGPRDPALTVCTVCFAMCALRVVLPGAFMTPDVTAPGVNIYAPVSKKVTGMENNFLSGTSM